jgi:heterodisulfide reductase subunit D
VGCTSSYRQTEIARATFSLLKKVKADFTLSPEEWCCGSPLLRTGQTDLVEQIVKHNIEVAKKLGAKKIVFSCAGCFRTFKEDYPRILKQETGIELLHITEYLYDLLKNGKLKLTKEFPHPVTYHDQCHLGRHIGVYDAPREILKAMPGVRFIEMRRIKENAWCCGAGGGVKSGFKDWALEIAKQRIKEAESTNAEYLISSCPFCQHNLSDAIAALNSNLKMLDITRLLNLMI